MIEAIDTYHEPGKRRGQGVRDPLQGVLKGGRAAPFLPFVVTLLLILQVALLLSCTREIRYTEDEISGFTPETRVHIRNGEIAFFMAQEEVRFAIGSPTDILVLPPRYDGKERIQWTYKKWGGVITTTLVFVDNKLMEITSNDQNLKRR